MTLQELEQYSPAKNLYDVQDQLKRHIYQRSQEAFSRGDAARDAIVDLEKLRQRQQAIQEFFVSCLGGLPPADSDLQARTVGKVKGHSFIIEKVIFESRPKHYVTANLYLPNSLSKPGGAVMFLCGHAEEAKHYKNYQMVCQTLVQAGLIVLAQDPVGQGERLSYYEPELNASTIRWGVTEHDYAGIQCQPLGDAIGRYFLHDAMRGLDYLQSRPEVDPQKIGVTGNSGGGTQTSMMMMTDSRIAAAAPATFIMNRHTYMLAGGAQDAEQIWPGFTAAGFDHEDILLAMAPKPVRVLAVTSDFFPIEGTRITVNRCKRVWELCGEGANLDMVEDHSTHMYTPTLARAAADFFSRHLLGQELEPKGTVPSVFEPASLWCTQSGQIRGEIPDAGFVQEANRERLVEVEGNRKTRSPVQQREKALSWLRQRVFSNRKPGELNPRFYPSGVLEGMSVELSFWWSQEGIFNFATLFQPLGHRKNALPVTLAVWDGGTTMLKPHFSWIRGQCDGGRSVMVLDVSGAGALTPNPLTAAPPHEYYGVIRKFADDLVWLDDDLAALRTFDVIRALDMIAAYPGLDKSDCRVYAHGKHGLYAQLAAALDSRITQLEVTEGLESFTRLVSDRYYDAFDVKSIMLRGILQHFDLPDLMQWGTL